MEIDVVLPPEFEIACDILYVKPVEVIQAFIANVSLAHYCSTDQFLIAKSRAIESSEDSKLDTPICLNGDLRLMATDFLISYNSVFNERLMPAKKIHEKYLGEFPGLINQLKCEPIVEMRYYKLLMFYNDWHKELINNMSENDALIDVKSKKTRNKI